MCNLGKSVFVEGDFFVEGGIFQNKRGLHVYQRDESNLTPNINLINIHTNLPIQTLPNLMPNSVC